jgi:alpha-tubulin suppressor-like RCC1 family protein
MSGEYSDGGARTAENESSSAAGCSLSERLRPKIRKAPDLEGLAVFSWGRGEDGQLGLGDTSDQDEPTYVDALRGVGVRQIACGSGHTVVLSTEGEVFTWGKYIVTNSIALSCC